MLTDLKDSKLVELNRVFYDAIGVNPEATLSALQAISSAKETVEPKQTPEPVNILRRIYTNEDIVIKASDGKKTLYDAKDVFARRNSAFIDLKLNNKGQATPDTKVEIYELIADATFRQMFNSLTSNWDKLVLTQNQIRDFVQEYRSKLHIDGFGAFFLLKENNEYLIADVYFRWSDKIIVDVIRLGSPDAWLAHDKYRLVAPQLQVLVP